MIVCPPCRLCALETEYTGKDSNGYNFECSCWVGISQNILIEENK